MKVLAGLSIDPIADPTRLDKESVATTCVQAL
jgi:hypothetical protein